MNIRELFVTLFKNKYQILVVLLITTATATIGTLLLPPTYEAKSALLIKFGREFVYLSEVGDSKVPYNYFHRDAIINAEIEILNSQDLIEKVIQSIGIDSLYPDLQKSITDSTPVLGVAVKKFSENLMVKGGKNSNIIQVSFQHNNPEMAAKTVNLIAELFQEKHLKTFSDTRTSGFLAEKVSDYEKRLETTEQKIEEFKLAQGAFLIEAQLPLLIRRHDKLDEQYRNMQSEANALREQLDSLVAEMATVSESTSLYSETDQNKYVIDTVKKELLDLQLKEIELLAKVNEKSDQVTNIRKSIKLVEEYLKEIEEDQTNRVTIGKNEVYQELEKQVIQIKSDLRAVEAKSETLGLQKEAAEKDLQEFILNEKTLRQLNRELDNIQTDYLNYRKNLEEVRISNEMDNQKMTNIRVIQKAAVPIHPIKPKKVLNIILGIILGFLAGLSLAFVKEYFNQSFTTEDRFEKRTGLPVLSIIGYKK